jgi:hypothetical protein
VLGLGHGFDPAVAAAVHAGDIIEQLAAIANTWWVQASLSSHLNS